MKIGITTPRGAVGSKIVTQLMASTAHEIVLLDHQPHKSNVKYGQKVKTIDCNLQDVASVIAATKHLDMVYFVAPPDNASPGYLNDFIHFGQVFAKAVEVNQIPRVVFQSSYGAHLPCNTGPIVGLHHIEQALLNTSANTVFLRACYFMENFLWFNVPINEHGVIPLPVKKSSSTIFNSTRDIANRAVNWLSNPAWSGKIVDEIHGESLTFEEVANLIGQRRGKAIDIMELSDEQSLESYTQPHIGFSEHYTTLFNELHRAIDSGVLVAEFNNNTESGVDDTFADFVNDYF